MKYQKTKMNNMEAEKVKKCCAICEYIDKPNCPLYYVYINSKYNNVFREIGKYKMLCDEFEVNSKLVEGIQDDEDEDESGQ